MFSLARTLMLPHKDKEFEGLKSASSLNLVLVIGVKVGVGCNAPQGFILFFTWKYLNIKTAD